MNWSVLVQILIIIVGWFIINWLGSLRDRANKLRDIRLEYLIKTFQKLANASIRGPDPQYHRDIEEATSDIHLFGTESQIEKVNDYCIGKTKNQEPSIDPLLDDLRAEQRRQLKLGAIKKEIGWIRFVKIGNEDAN